MGQRIPVHVVTGPGAGEWIAAMCARRGDWVGLVSEPTPAERPNVKLLSLGCPCCTGKVVLQVALVRAVRATRATRAFVQLPDAAHAPALKRVLAEPPFNVSLVPARPVLLPQDAEVQPANLED